MSLLPLIDPVGKTPPSVDDALMHVVVDFPSSGIPLVQSEKTSSLTIVLAVIARNEFDEVGELNQDEEVEQGRGEVALGVPCPDGSDIIDSEATSLI